MDPVQPEAHEHLLKSPCWHHPPPLSTPAQGRREDSRSRTSHSSFTGEYLSKLSHLIPKIRLAQPKGKA